MSAPAYRAYTVIKREGKDDYWLNIGVSNGAEGLTRIGVEELTTL